MKCAQLLLLYTVIHLAHVQAWNQPRETTNCYSRQTGCSPSDLQHQLLRDNILLVKQNLEKDIQALHTMLETCSERSREQAEEIKNLTKRVNALEPCLNTSIEAPTTTELPTDVTTDLPTETSTDFPTESPTELTTEFPTEHTTELPTEQTTELPTELTTELPTGHTTELPTELTTELPTEQTTELPTPTDQQPPTCGNSIRDEQRVAYLDMTDPNQQCPDGFRSINSTSPPLRLCGRMGPITGCISTIFPVNGREYTHVYGRIIAYQYGAPFAFYGDHLGEGLDSTYVDGISLTHGSPRQHIWTFAAGPGDTYVEETSWVCACSHSEDVDPPPYVGEDYFCETANHNNISAYRYSMPFYDHPLWDGQDCGPNDTNCCSFHNPPWFCKQLPQPTTDDIELRQCNIWNQDSDTPLQIIEIYVK